METAAPQSDEAPAPSPWDYIPPFDLRNYTRSESCLKCNRAFGPRCAEQSADIHDAKGRALTTESKRVVVFFGTDIDGVWKAHGVSQNGVHDCVKCEQTSRTRLAGCPHTPHLHPNYVHLETQSPAEQRPVERTADDMAAKAASYIAAEEAGKKPAAADPAYKNCIKTPLIRGDKDASAATYCCYMLVLHASATTCCCYMLVLLHTDATCCCYMLVLLHTVTTY